MKSNKNSIFERIGVFEGQERMLELSDSVSTA